MIGLDTNVLVRFLVQDDEEQSPRATALMARLSPDRPGYLSSTVVVETYWVLTRAYDKPATEVTDTLTELVDNASIVTQDRDTVRRALALSADGAGLADAMIAESCSRAGCTAVASFDKHAARTLGFIAP